MALAPGSRVGPYEVLQPIGSGGMGVVHRARDHRLARDVAIKVLPEEHHRDPERRRRFEDEARAAGGLNHPNLLTVLDVGEADGALYLVTELLEGKTLRERLRAGPMPLRRALDLAAQLAEGLAAAHERGIIHRDLKPENVFVTDDDHAKILDFGLAKAVVKTQVDAHGATATPMTEPGAILGTLGYMAPEQVRGEPADARSDVFSLGAILHEMLTGKPAFTGASAVEVGYATINHEPAELPATVPPPVARLVTRCLEKAPAKRFQSTRDLAFALDALVGAPTSSPSQIVSAPTPRRARWRWLAIAAASAAAAAALTYLVIRRGEAPATTEPAPQATNDVQFQRVVFRIGTIGAARFAPDGRSVVYSANFTGRSQTYVAVPGNPEARPLFDDEYRLLDVSSTGELALTPSRVVERNARGNPVTAARVPLSGGTPRTFLQDVFNMSWTADGASVNAVIGNDGVYELHMPVGQPRYRSTAALSSVDTAPDGTVVVAERFFDTDARGAILLFEPGGGEPRKLASYRNIIGVRWRSDDELWLSARTDTGYALIALRRDGTERTLLVLPSSAQLHDVDAAGRVLLSFPESRHRVAGQLRGASKEVELSWFDGSDAIDLAPDGQTILFYESFDAAVHDRTTYLREGARPAIQLAVGVPLALSPDRSLALVTPPPHRTLELVPTGAGSTKALHATPLHEFSRAFWSHDGTWIAIDAAEQGKGNRVWRLDLGGGPPRPLTEEGEFTAAPPSPDDQWLAVVDREHGVSLVATDGGARRQLTGLERGDVPIQWSPDGKELIVRGIGDDLASARGYMTSGSPARLLRYDLATSTRAPWRDVGPVDDPQLVHIDNVLVTAEGDAYVYSYLTETTVLYLLEGLR